MTGILVGLPNYLGNRRSNSTPAFAALSALRFAVPSLLPLWRSRCNHSPAHAAESQKSDNHDRNAYGSSNKTWSHDLVPKWP